MSAADDFFGLGPYSLSLPASRDSAFVFNSPHSGAHYPDRFMAMSRLDRLSIRRSEDCYVDQLFGGAVALGAPLLAANFPRAYLDVNREPWELDPRMFVEPLPAFANVRSTRVAGGLGTVPRIVGEGQDIYAAKLPLAEAVSRVDALYKPYHMLLRTLLLEARTRNGHAVLVDCHSMPGSLKAGEGRARPDFVVGDRFGTAAAADLSQLAIWLLTSMGYVVAHNKPYAGGYITEHYGRPAKGFHAIQIEVNRRIYMDESNLRKLTGFQALAEDLTEFSARLIAGARDMFGSLPLAAE